MATETPFHASTAILARVIQPQEANLPPEAARAFLSLHFSADDQQRMAELLEKAKQGTLTSAEAAQAEAFDQVGHFLALLQSKARLSLARSSRDAG